MQQNQDPRNREQDKSRNQENDPITDHIMDENHEITDEDIRNHQPEIQRDVTAADVTTPDEELENEERRKNSDGDENDIVTPWDVVNPTL